MSLIIPRTKKWKGKHPTLLATESGFLWGELIYNIMKQYVVTIMFFVLLGVCIFSTKPYHSYSGSLYLLSQHGEVVRDAGKSQLHYYCDDSVMTDDEVKALAKLSQIYDVKY